MDDAQEIHEPRERQLEEQRHQVAVLIARADAVSVSDAETNQAAARLLSQIKGRAKELDEHRKTMTRPMDEAKARVMDLFRPILEELQKAEKDIKASMAAWDEHERRRIAAERQAAEAEQARLATEAAKAAQEGRVAEAVELAEASLAAVPTSPEAPQRARGTSLPNLWRAEVVDFAALVLATATGEAPINLLQPNQSALDALARATKQEGVVLPGVRFIRETSVRVRADHVR